MSVGFVLLIVILDTLALGMCTVWSSAVSHGDGTTIMRSYAKLSASDRAQYDPVQIKRVQQAFIVLLGAVMVTVFTGMAMGSNQTMAAVSCLLLVAIAVLRGLIDRTDFFLTRFCRRRG